MYSIYFIYKQYYTVYIYDYTYHIYCMRLTIVSLLNLIGFVHVCANHFLFVFIQLMASCLVSLSIDRAWEGRSLTSWIVLNSNYVICLTFRLRLGLQPSQVVDSTDYRKDCEEFYEPLVFFYISSFRRLCLRIVLHPPIQQRKHWVEDCEGSITCRTLSSGEDHELGRGIPWHLEMMDTWQDHEWTRLPFWRSNGSCDRN